MITVKPMTFLMNCGDLMSADSILATDEVDDDPEAVDAVLGQIARYRLSTFAAMAQLPELSDKSPRYLRRVLRDCRAAGLLSSAALHSGMRYWFLTDAGAARCGLDQSRSGPLSEPAKLRAYAMLVFCCLSAAPRYRLTAKELSEQFSVLHRRGMPGTYYFDPTATGCIVWPALMQVIRTLGPSGAVRARGHLTAHQTARFRQLIAAHRFELTVLTVLPAKAERTASVLNSLPEVKHVPVHVVAQPSCYLSSVRASERRKPEQEPDQKTPSAWVSSLPAPEQGKTTGSEPESPQTELTFHKRSLSIHWM